ncbi:MAG: glycogen synthase [Nonlabens sp.]
MKVTFLTREFPPHVYGGAGVHVEYLAKFLEQLMEVEVRCFGDQEIKTQPLTVKGYDYDDPFFHNADKQLKGLLQTLQTGVQMNVAPVDSDIVHCHTWYSHFAGIIAKLCYGTPLVVTTHSLEPLRPWKRDQLGGGYDASTWVEKTAIEMADAIIAVSKETKEDVLTHFNVAPEKIEVIYNGIDLQEYHKTESVEALVKHGIDPEKPYVLFVGRITKQKGIIHLVNAIKYLDSNTQVVLCAGAPDTEEISREMEHAVTEARKERENIIWIAEMLDKPSVIELYSHAAVFCCPSIYEPFGIINVEAMACGCPVVASAVGGIKEVVIDGETGSLVPLNQQKQAPFEPVEPDLFSRDLAQAINKLVKNPDLRAQMGKAGRKRVEEYFDWKAIAEQTASLYQSLKN